MFAGHHDAEVHDLEVVALQDDANDVLADVVHIALDRREHDPAVRAAMTVFLFLDVRHEMADCPLHHARRFHNLRQEHLARAEQVANDIHAGHQRALDNVERPLRLLAGLFGIVDDKFVDAVDERVLESFRYVEFAPGQVLPLGRSA